MLIHVIRVFTWKIREDLTGKIAFQMNSGALWKYLPSSYFEVFDIFYFTSLYAFCLNDMLFESPNAYLEKHKYSWLW